MSYENEKELQIALAKRLQRQGHSVQLEVPCEGGRIDILTPSHIIETKHYLTRQSINEAAGQLGPYSVCFPNRQCVIAGLYPKDRYEANAAAARQKLTGVEVWFLNDGLGFNLFNWMSPSEEKGDNNLGQIIGTVGVIGLLLYLAINGMTGRTSRQTTEPNAPMIEIATESLLTSSDECDRVIGQLLSDGDFGQISKLKSGCKKRAESIKTRLGL